MIQCGNRTPDIALQKQETIFYPSGNMYKNKSKHKDLHKQMVVGKVIVIDKKMTIRLKADLQRTDLSTSLVPSPGKQIQ